MRVTADLLAVFTERYALFVEGAAGDWRRVRPSRYRITGITATDHRNIPEAIVEPVSATDSPP
jgi:hypothetical protein